MHMYLQIKSQFLVDYVPCTSKIPPFQPPEAEEVWTSLRMSIDLVNVSLELLPIQLFEHPDENADYAQLPSLARIDFIKSKFEFESLSDWSKTIDLVSEDVIFEDTRHKGTFSLYICLLAIFRYCLGFFIDPMHKWLPIKNSFVSIKISPTNLVFELIIQKNFYSQTRLVGLI